MQKKKVLLLATGGTIACTHSEEGLAPELSGAGILDLLPELKEDFAIESRDILNLDSSNIQPEEWQFMAEQVAEALPDYDGIIITHGTDTMGFDAFESISAPYIWKIYADGVHLEHSQAGEETAAPILNGGTSFPS